MRRRRPAIDGGGLDLTPMIDVVFNLIIFFMMLVSELSNLEVEQVRLPFAGAAERPRPELARVLQVNVGAGGEVRVRGRAWGTDPAARSRAPWIGDLLAAEAAGCEREPAQGSGPAPSALRVNLRADREARFGHVQAVLDACQRQGVYRTSLAATLDLRD